MRALENLKMFIKRNTGHGYNIFYCALSQGFPLQAEYQSMVNVTSAGPGLSPSMDYRTGCRNGPTQGLDWTPDYCGNG